MGSLADSSSTIVDLLRARALDHPNRLAFVFLEDGESRESQLTYGELDFRARAIGARLVERGASGRPALLLYAPGLEFITAFFGCLYAGALAIPVYPPGNNRSWKRLAGVVADARAEFGLTTSGVLSRRGHALESRQDQSGWPSLRWLATDDAPAELAAEWTAPAVDSDSLAFLQYTSGSTGSPKGVMVNHANIIHNQFLLKNAFGMSEQSVVVSWLPLYHDMGLIGNVIHPVFGGAQAVLMSHVAFMQKPSRWLQAVSHYRADISGGPNFAYDLCAWRINANQSADWDLSCWRTAYNAAEQTRVSTMDRFAEAFERYGFRRKSFFTCYGLAEATLFVSGTQTSRPPECTQVSSAVGGPSEKVETLARCAPKLKDLVSYCGSQPDQQIVIVDPKSQTICQEAEVGEIWVSGPSVCQGYWQRPDETAITFRATLPGLPAATFLRSGDLGFLSERELFISGRLKDLIIIRGANHYPEDIEATVQGSHPALINTSGAAFSVEVSGEERLVIVQEVNRSKQHVFNAIVDAISQSVARDHALQVYAVLLIRAGKLPKTTSGKVQRSACREAFLNQTLDPVMMWQTSSISDHGRVPVASLPTPPKDLEGVEKWLRAQLVLKLGIEANAIGADTMLDRLGIDSLRTVELQFEIENTFGLVIHFGSILSDLSLRQLAIKLATHVASRNGRTGVLPVVNRPIAWQLSSGQRALLFLHETAQHSTAYNISRAFRIVSPLDVCALKRALHSLIERHEVLRTRIAVENGKPLQMVQPMVDNYLETEDAASWNEYEVRKELQRRAQRPFDLAEGPVCRVTLFDRPDGRHFLLFSVHHICADLRSLEILADDLRRLYIAETRGEVSDLPPLESHYSDFVKWQSELLSGPEGTRLLEYWQTQLARPLPVLDLPVDHQRSPSPIHNGGSRKLTITSDLTRSLRAFAQSEATSLFTVLLSSFQVLLHRYTGQEDLLVGVPALGRARARFSGVVGYFTNPVVLRARFSDDVTSRRLLREVRSSVFSALAAQDYPFPLLVDRLKVDRKAGRSPLFDCLFVFHAEYGLKNLPRLVADEDGAEVVLGDLTIENISLPQQESQFDLSLTVTEQEESLLCSLEYNSDLFEPHTAERMLAHFRTVLAGMAEMPDARVSALPLLSDAERDQVLVEWNETQVDYPKNTFVHQLFEAQAEISPEAVAVECKGEKVTYRELNCKANQLARWLRAKGVGPEVLVGICVDRSIEMVVGLLGILKAGGAYVALDPDYPPELLAFMLEDTQVYLVLSQSHLIGKLPKSRCKQICLDSDWASVASTSEENPPNTVNAENLAYLIYTSGSTGRPKGVAITHGSVATFLYWAKETFAKEVSAGVLASTSICFDLSIFELFVPLSCGGKVILAQHALHLGDLAAANEVTLINTVPSAIVELLNMDAIPDSVRTVNLAGEALTSDVVNSLYRRENIQQVFNLYGPSEDTTYSTFALAKRDCNDVPAIGRPIANTQVYLLDKQLRIVPIGVAGEMYLGGNGLARGYLNRPELTANRFIPNPFGGQPGSRLYKTGDLCKRLPDGNIQFLGRLDRQVKIRGLRIELGEIEITLNQCPGVHKSAVIVREDEPGDRRLVAYFVAATQSPPVIDDLSNFLRTKLPAYMVPQVYVMLDALPLTPNGKLNLKALPEPAHIRPGTNPAYVTPRSAVEELLSAEWADVLGLERVGAHDNFFDLGGNSLVALRLASRLQSVLSTHISPNLFFEAPSIAQFAVAVAQAEIATQDCDEGLILQLLESAEQSSNDQARWLAKGEASLEAIHVTG